MTPLINIKIYQNISNISNISRGRKGAKEQEGKGAREQGSKGAREQESRGEEGLGPKHLCSTRVASQIDGRKRPLKK